EECFPLPLGNCTRIPAGLKALQGDCPKKLNVGRRNGWLGGVLLFFLTVARVLLPLLALLTLLALLSGLLAIHVLRALRGLLFRLLIAIRTVLFHLVTIFHC